MSTGSEEHTQPAQSSAQPNDIDAIKDDEIFPIRSRANPGSLVSEICMTSDLRIPVQSGADYKQQLREERGQLYP
ncbi:hypothetical protein JCM8547_000873 [Rhodosporidiobolus lusitaniae]